jgi:hypothetical protein
MKNEKGIFMFGKYLKVDPLLKTIALAVGLAEVFFLAGCGGASSGATSTNQQAAPAIVSQPASQAVLAGQTATFNVVASGTQPLTYQWQANSVTIAGATNASYTTPATTVADNGTNYTVVVSNTKGTVTSSDAVLTVANPSCSAVPAVPSGLAATASSATAINLTWTAVSAPANCAIVFYNVYGSTTSGFKPSTINLLKSVTSGTSYSNTGLTA